MRRFASFQPFMTAL